MIQKIRGIGMKCIVCGESEHSVEYLGKIRTGSFGKLSEVDHSVLKCNSCGLVSLNTLSDPAFYESDEYRMAYNDTSSVDDYQSRHDPFETQKISLIGLHKIRGMDVADFGCGAGAFLDAVSGVAKNTIAVEPAKIFHDHLTKRHELYAYGADMVTSGVKVDIATSFDVVEHVEDCIAYLSQIRAALSDNGTLYLMTPNYNEILTQLLPEKFSPFNFRTAHLYYFTSNTITMALKKAGFNNVKVGYTHKFDLSNLLYWFMEGRPTGVGNIQLFDDEFNAFFIKYLERKGAASHLWVTAN